MKKPLNRMPRTCRQCPVLPLNACLQQIRGQAGCYIMFKRAMEVSDLMKDYLKKYGGVDENNLNELLPDGWCFIDSHRSNILVIKSPNGFVTIDKIRRGFSLGFCCYARVSEKYSGKGWLEMLVSDAVSELKKIN